MVTCNQCFSALFALVGLILRYLHSRSQFYKIMSKWVPLMVYAHLNKEKLCNSSKIYYYIAHLVSPIVKIWKKMSDFFSFWKISQKWESWLLFDMTSTKKADEFALVLALFPSERTLVAPLIRAVLIKALLVLHFIYLKYSHVLDRVRLVKEFQLQDELISKRKQTRLKA